MTFQASDLKGRHFLDLLEDDLYSIEPLYIEGDSWIKYFRHSNLLCIRAIRAITNYTPIGKYHLCFFSRENFSCLYRSYPIETRYHILYDFRT